jgi:hypothetical protein
MIKTAPQTPPVWTVLSSSLSVADGTVPAGTYKLYFGYSSPTYVYINEAQRGSQFASVLSGQYYTLQDQVTKLLFTIYLFNSFCRCSICHFYYYYLLFLFFYSHHKGKKNKKKGKDNLIYGMVLSLTTLIFLLKNK